jgi:hypothetical protein
VVAALMMLFESRRRTRRLIRETFRHTQFRDERYAPGKHSEAGVDAYLQPAQAAALPVRRHTLLHAINTNVPTGTLPLPQLRQCRL